MEAKSEEEKCKEDFIGLHWNVTSNILNQYSGEVKAQRGLLLKEDNEKSFQSDVTLYAMFERLAV